MLHPLLCLFTSSNSQLRSPVNRACHLTCNLVSPLPEGPVCLLTGNSVHLFSNEICSSVPTTAWISGSTSAQWSAPFSTGRSAPSPPDDPVHPLPGHLVCHVPDDLVHPSVLHPYPERTPDPETKSGSRERKIKQNSERIQVVSRACQFWTFPCCIMSEVPHTSILCLTYTPFVLLVFQHK